MKKILGYLILALVACLLCWTIIYLRGWLYFALLIIVMPFGLLIAYFIVLICEKALRLIND